MKKSLLLLSALAMSAASAFAQWTQPVPQFVPMADDGETEQYLYNVEAGGFFMASNDWQTRASIVYTEGAKVKMTKVYEDPDSKDVWLNTWSIIDYVPKFNEFRKTFADNPKSIWTDNNNGANCDNWVVTALGDNKYEITNPLAGQGKLGMADIDGQPNTRLWLLDATDEENWVNDEGNVTFSNPCTTWAFVSPEEYDLLIPRIAAYNASLSLKALMESDDAKLVDLAASKAVYDNTSSTAEELKAAEEALKAAILEAKATQVSPENPVDMTTAIVNPNFDGIKFDGWGGSSWGAGGTTDECAERYEMTFDTYQDLAGLPKGVYKVLVNGFFRGPAENTPVLYAKSGDDLLTTLFYLRDDFAAEEQVGGLGVQTADGRWAPNSMQDFVAYENAGYYNDLFVYVPVGDGGDLRIGVKKDKNAGGDWVICDTWRLIYYGNSAAAYKFWFDDIKASIVKKMDAMVTDDTKYDKTQKAAFEAAIAAGEAAQSEADFRAAIEGLNAAADAAIASIDAYKKYMDKLEEIREYLGENSDIVGEQIGLLADYCSEADAVEPDDEWKNGSAAYILENCQLSTEEITAETEWLEEYFKEAIKTGMEEGSDVSFMLVNPKFDQQFEGWTYKEGKLGDKNVECYQQVVDCYQIVNDVPNGLYMLTCQSFERHGENGQWTGEEDPSVFLFMNNFQSPVQNIGKGGISYDEAVNKVNCMLNDDGVADNVWPNDYDHPEWGIVPNSVTGARYAFEGGRYVQTVYGLVTDGTMKIGLTSNGKQIHWVLWANFTLTYMGKNAEALESVIGDLSQILSNYIEEHQDELSNPVVAAATAAIEAGDNASGSDELWSALEKINDVTTAAKANVAAVEAFNKAKDAMSEAAENYGETASEEAMAAYSEMSDADCADMTTEEIEAATVKMNEIAGQLRIPANASTASDENPVDMTQVIVNASFDEGVEGWSGDTPAYNSEIADAEFYNKNFDMYQEFYGMPAGTYELKVQGYYRQGGAADDWKAFTGETEAAYNAKLYANNDSIGICQTSTYSQESKEEIAGWAKAGTGDDGDVYIPNTMTTGGQAFADEEANPYWNSLIFKYDGKGALKIGLAKNVLINTDWTLFDNFQLWYYGANSSKEPNGGTNGIVEVAPAASATATAVYNAAGMKVQSLVKGLNIMKMSDGTVRKIYIK